MPKALMKKVPISEEEFLRKISSRVIHACQFVFLKV